MLPLHDASTGAKADLERELQMPPAWRFLAKPYLHDNWNCLDFFIVVISVLSLLLPSLRALRALRALRPLRLVSRYEDLKITVDTLFLSIPAMFSIFLVTALFFVIFSILGMELFGGRFGYCMDPEYSDLPYGSRVVPGLSAGGQTDYEECMALPRYNITRRTTDGILLTEMADLYPHAEPSWLVFTEFPQWMYPQFGTFDHIGEALLLLFELSALEMWPDVLHVAMDADPANLFIEPFRVPSSSGNGMGGVNVSMQEHETMPIEAGIFFICWIVLGCFIFVNLTVGVVVDTFAKIKEENDGALLMSADAAEWVRTQKELLTMAPRKAREKPPGYWRARAFDVVTSTRFEIGVMAVISMNMLMMACDWWEPSVNDAAVRPKNEVMQVLDYVFIAAYTLEMLLKMVGLTVQGYFADRWNLFDFILVCAAYVDVILSNAMNQALPIPPTLIRVLRLVRVVRIMRLFRSAKQMRTIILTVWISLPALKNIMMLILLIIVIIDVFCVDQFYGVNYTPGNFDLAAPHDGLEMARRGEVLYPPDAVYYFNGENNWGDMVNRHANFATFWTGFLTLVRASTGESFNGIMHDLFGWDWGHNRLTCCPQCGPIVDGEVLKAFALASGGVLAERRVPEDSCGDTAWGIIIYLLFQVLMAYIVLSIMIGVILENFSDSSTAHRKISTDDIEDFREAWVKYDPLGTFVIESHNLLPLLQSVKPPLGCKGVNPPMTRSGLLRLQGELNIPDHGGYIHFTECLTAISYYVSGVPVLPECAGTKRLQKYIEAVPRIKSLERPAHNSLTNYLVSMLGARYRAYVAAEARGGTSTRGGAAPPTANGVPIAVFAPADDVEPKARVKATRVPHPIDGPPP